MCKGNKVCREATSATAHSNTSVRSIRVWLTSFKVLLNFRNNYPGHISVHEGLELWMSCAILVVVKPIFDTSNIKTIHLFALLSFGQLPHTILKKCQYTSKMSSVTVEYSDIVQTPLPPKKHLLVKTGLLCCATCMHIICTWSVFAWCIFDGSFQSFAT